MRGNRELAELFIASLDARNWEAWADLTTFGLTAALMKAMTRTLADGAGHLFTDWPVGPGLL